MTERPTCCQAPGCHNLLEPVKHGRGKKWCSRRCRRAQYGGRCADCGKQLDGSNGWGPNASQRCVSCASAARTVWTRSTVIAAIQEWALLYGEPPVAWHWNPTMARYRGHESYAVRFEAAHGRWPWAETVRSVFGSWNAAIAAAGFEPKPSGCRGKDVISPRGLKRPSRPSASAVDGPADGVSPALSAGPRNCANERR